MVNFTYYLAKSVEFISCRIGAGAFEVNPHYLCSSCAAKEGKELCPDCKDSWLDELSVLEYSDAYERRINVSMGLASLVLGFVAAVANKGEGWWVEGSFAAWLTYPFTFLPTLSPTARIISHYIFTLIFLISLFIIFANMLVAGFLMAMNPIGERHWKNMNWGVYVVFTLQGALIVAVYCLGGMVKSETIFVGVPVLFGTAALGFALCIGLGKGKGGDAGSVKLGDEEASEGPKLSSA